MFLFSTICNNVLSKKKRTPLPGPQLVTGSEQELRLFVLFHEPSGLRIVVHDCLAVVFFCHLREINEKIKVRTAGF